MFTQRFLAGQRDGQRRGLVDSAVAEQRFGQSLLGPPMQLQQTGCLVPARAPAVQLDEGVALEQSEGFAQQGHGAGRLTHRDQAGRLFVQALEPAGIDLVVTDGDGGSLSFLPGVGRGFFDDRDPPRLDLPGNVPIRQAPAGPFLLAGTGEIFRIDPDNFLGGRMRLDRAKSVEAVRRVAAPLGLGLMEAAAGIARIAEFKMADIIRKMTVEKGFDPREFVPFRACAHRRALFRGNKASTS